MPQRYSKTHAELAYLLVSRGMGSASGLSDDELRKTISERLAAVNYYRLSAYWYQFRCPLATSGPQCLKMPQIREIITFAF